MDGLVKRRLREGLMECYLQNWKGIHNKKIINY